MRLGTHHTEESRQKIGDNRTYITYTATCHPDREHVALGLCKLCYAKEYSKRPESIERVRKYQEANRARATYRARKHHLKKQYGITPEIYDAMLAKQDDGCAICSAPPTGPSLYVDHNHTTQQVRGLLCQNCNFGIGMFKEQQHLLRNAIEYLNQYEALAA